MPLRKQESSHRAWFSTSRGSCALAPYSTRWTKASENREGPDEPFESRCGHVRGEIRDGTLCAAFAISRPTFHLPRPRVPPAMWIPPVRWNLSLNLIIRLRAFAPERGSPSGITWSYVVLYAPLVIARQIDWYTRAMTWWAARGGVKVENQADPETFGSVKAAVVSETAMHRRIWMLTDGCTDGERTKFKIDERIMIYVYCPALFIGQFAFVFVI